MCNYLDHLPMTNFNFGSVQMPDPYMRKVNNKSSCGTVGCVIGHTPNLFPQLCRVTYNDGANDCINYKHYAHVAMDLFGIATFAVAEALFTPEEQGFINLKLPTCTAYATPQEVSAILRDFLSKVDDIDAPVPVPPLCLPAPSAPVPADHQL